MRLHLLDPAYTDRLTAYLRSVGQQPIPGGPDSLDLEAEPAEVAAYLRVWKVLYPDAEVEILQ